MLPSLKQTGNQCDCFVIAVGIEGCDITNALTTTLIHWSYPSTLQINGLVRGRCNSSVLAMELRLSCTYPLTYSSFQHISQLMVTQFNDAYMHLWATWCLDIAYKLQWNLNQNIKYFFQENKSHDIIWKMTSILSQSHIKDIYLKHFL